MQAETTTLTVLVCDLDGFKQVNDRFGHLVGNRVLRRWARAMNESCREYDYVARMGGDEFVVIAPGLPADAAEKRATITATGKASGDRRMRRGHTFSKHGSSGFSR